MAAPTVYDALTAYGTVGASVIALAFGVVAEARTRADRKERVAEHARQREADRRWQAEHVAIWREQAPARRTGALVPYLAVHNASDLPITEVTVPLTDDQGQDASWLIDALVPGETRRREFRDELLRVNGDLRVHFTDNGSVMWSRRFTGELAERGVRQWVDPPDLKAEPPPGRA